MVVRERVAVAGDKFGATEDAGRTIPDVPGIIAPTTPFVTGGATPMHGGATPLHGGATPMHDSMGYVENVVAIMMFHCSSYSHFFFSLACCTVVTRCGGLAAWRLYRQGARAAIKRRRLGTEQRVSGTESLWFALQ